MLTKTTYQYLVTTYCIVHPSYITRKGQGRQHNKKPCICVLCVCVVLEGQRQQQRARQTDRQRHRQSVKEWDRRRARVQLYLGDFVCMSLPREVEVVALYWLSSCWLLCCMVHPRQQCSNQPSPLLFAGLRRLRTLDPSLAHLKRMNDMFHFLQA